MNLNIDCFRQALKTPREPRGFLRSLFFLNLLQLDLYSNLRLDNFNIIDSHLLSNSIFLLFCFVLENCCVSLYSWNVVLFVAMFVILQAPRRRGSWGGYSPPSFGAKVYKLTKLKAKVVNILKICQVFNF